MLAQRRRRWASIVQVLCKCFKSAGYAFTSLGKHDSGDKKITQVLRLIALKQPSQQAQVVYPMLI